MRGALALALALAPMPPTSRTPSCPTLKSSAQRETTMRIGLAANRLHHESADAALFRWLRASEAGIRELGVELHAAG